MDQTIFGKQIPVSRRGVPNQSRLECLKAVSCGPFFCHLHLYINDLPDVIQGCIRPFADDSKICWRISRIEHVEILQSCLNKALTWAGIWEMFNLLKWDKFTQCNHQMEKSG